jgi:hypothetical protein
MQLAVQLIVIVIHNYVQQICVQSAMIPMNVQMIMTVKVKFVL